MTSRGLSQEVQLDHARGVTPLVALLIFTASFGWGVNPQDKKTDVVLVHGILNKPFVMNRIASALKKQGYVVHNWGYPSTAKTIEQHAENLNSFVQTLSSATPVHFVGFSQGALIIRYTLTHYSLPNVGRFVMIAPPNHGCEIAENFYRYRWFRGLYGDQSIKQLFAKQNEFLEKCGIPKTEFGIIAGGRKNENGFTSRIPGDDDGTISVASAQLEGSRDFIILPHLHTSLLFSSDTSSQVISFLSKGQFERSQ